ncbi:carboxymuconolactone decarboxylase family protein [Amycolatopsis sp. OK19-0408]|uniref:Carboxymuconolactone decarboxylase family protein n=1 Tax=Amycolatopsis iheyensis TaxID=2945988 RepID=A0A9X2N6G8_9PSEU|nr:carboxymuconolactone decarboxylase family protein [Amycolatopsis iheyensis]MCR6483226.1 carboxymuconolactone decarboxylase family protein [Amycolatopsis iheyensis]
MTTTETSLDRLAALDPAFARMVGATAKHVRAIPELTDREKTFLCVTADVCQASLGLAFTAHVRAGLAAGVSTSDVRELLRFVSYDCGYHAATAGIERIAELERELGLDPEPVVPEPVPAGPSPLPAEVRARLTELDPQFTAYFDLQSRMRAGHGPGTLSERERGLVSLSVDLHYQTLADTFRIHVGRALRGGATPEDVRAALRFNAQFGVTRAWHAWEALNAILAES